MDTRNTSEDQMTGAGREDNEPPAGYGGQEEIAADEATDSGTKHGQTAQPEGTEEVPPASER